MRKLAWPLALVVVAVAMLLAARLLEAPSDATARPAPAPATVQPAAVELPQPEAAAQPLNAAPAPTPAEPVIPPDKAADAMAEPQRGLADMVPPHDVLVTVLDGNSQ